MSCSARSCAMTSGCRGSSLNSVSATDAVVSCPAKTRFSRISCTTELGGLHAVNLTENLMSTAQHCRFCLCLCLFMHAQSCMTSGHRSRKDRKSCISSLLPLRLPLRLYLLAVTHGGHVVMRVKFEVTHGKTWAPPGLTVKTSSCHACHRVYQPPHRVYEPLHLQTLRCTNFNPQRNPSNKAKKWGRAHPKLVQVKTLALIKSRSTTLQVEKG